MHKEYAIVIPNLELIAPEGYTLSPHDGDSPAMPPGGPYWSSPSGRIRMPAVSLDLGQQRHEYA